MIRTDIIKEKVDSLAEVIGAKVNFQYGEPPSNMSSIEQATYIFSDTAYHLVFIEKRSERRRNTTRDLDELLYWIFSEVTFGMAEDYEMRHRRPNEDFRRQLFEVQLNLLGRLSPAWQAKESRKIKEALENAPYFDVN